MKSCPFCLEKIPESSKLCPKCGRTLFSKYSNLYNWTLPQLKEYAQKNNIPIAHSKDKMVQNIIDSNPKEKIRLFFVENLLKYPRLLKMLPLDNLLQNEILADYWEKFPLGNYNNLIDYLLDEKSKGSDFVEDWIDAIEGDLAVNENKIRRLLSKNSSFFAIFPDAPRDKFFKFNGKLQDFRKMQEEELQKQEEAIRKKIKDKIELPFVEKLILNPDLLKQIIHDFQLRPSIIKILSNIIVGTREIKSMDELMENLYDNLNHQDILKGLENILKNKEHYVVRLLEKSGIEIKPSKSFENIESTNGIILDNFDLDSFSKTFMKPEHLTKIDIDEFQALIGNQDTVEEVPDDDIKFDYQPIVKNKSFEYRYKSKILPPEVKAFSEYFYKSEIEESKFDLIDKNYHLGSSWLFTYPPKAKAKLSTIILSRNKKITDIFDFLISDAKPNIWYHFSTINIKAMESNKYFSIIQDALGNKYRRPLFFEVTKFLQILDFINNYKQDDIFAMEWISEYGLTIYIRISNRYYIGLRDCISDYEENVDVSDLKNFIKPLINKEFEYLFSWRLNQLKNYLLNNEITLEKRIKKINLIRTIQEFKPDYKPRLSFINNLYDYPEIFKKIFNKFKRGLSRYRLEWTSNLNAEEFEKYSSKVKNNGYDNVFWEHIKKHWNNDKFRALLEIDLNPVQEDIKNFISEEYPEVAKNVFPELITPLKIAKSDLYNLIIEKLGDLNISTKDFKHTRNIGKIGECYVCYNVLPHEFMQKYPKGNLKHDKNENGFRILLDNKEVVKVRWLNQNKESYEPHDILTIEKDLTSYIEVKTSKNDEVTFEISEKELNFASEIGDNYSLYFIGNIDSDIKYCKFENFYKKYISKDFQIIAYRMRYNEFV